MQVKTHSVLFLDCQVSKSIMKFIDDNREGNTQEQISGLIESELNINTNRSVVCHYLGGKPKECPVCRTPFYGAKSRALCSDSCRQNSKALKRQNQCQVMQRRRNSGDLPEPTFVGACKSIRGPDYLNAANRWLCGQAL